MLRSGYWNRFVRKYLSFGRFKTEKLKEIILRTMLFIDPKGKILSLITKRVRHQ